MILTHRWSGTELLLACAGPEAYAERARVLARCAPFVALVLLVEFAWMAERAWVWGVAAGAMITLAACLVLYRVRARSRTHKT